MPDYTSIHTGPVIDQGISDGLTAVQPGDLATVATSGDYTDLINIPATFVPSAHNHIATDITDFTEAVGDAVNGLLVAGANITLTYNDIANTFTIASSGGGGSSLSGDAVITLSTAKFEHEETVAATGVTGSSRVNVWLSPGTDNDENNPELLDLITLSAAPGTDQITITATFNELTSGPIKIQWSAF